MKRALTKGASLDLLERSGVKVEAVIDVGVQYGTPDLMLAYPNKPHILIEAVEEYSARIEAAYANIPHKLIVAAAADADGSGHLRTITQREGETITHAFLEDKGRPVRMARVDTMVAESGIPGPYLLKIDVEGWDIPGRIVDGSAGIMPQVNVIVCEMVTKFFVGIASKIETHGFALFDIVDACYYGGTLWQTDAIFIRRDQLTNSALLNPMSHEKFDAAKWWPSYV